MNTRRSVRAVLISGLLAAAVCSIALSAQGGSQWAAAQQVFEANTPAVLGGDAVPDFIVGPGTGVVPARALNGLDGSELASGLVFGGFGGGVRLAAGDVNGDGVADIIAGMGPGGSLVQLLSGVDAANLGSGYPFGAGFTGGVYVATGDVNGDGRTDIVVGQGNGGGGVLVFSGTDISLLMAVTPFGPGYTGGVTVAAGDVNGDGFADVFVGQASGGAVALLDGATRSPIASAGVFGGGGVFVALGDVNGDGRADAIMAPGAGNGPVLVYDVQTLTPLAAFLAYPAGFSAGVRVASTDLNGDGMAEIITAPGPGGGSTVNVFSGGTFAPYMSFPAYAPGFNGGVFITAPAATSLRITSAPAVTFTAGQAGTFTVQSAGGPPAATIVPTGALPAGVTFASNGDGTATLGGTPAPTSGGVYPLTLTASNGVSPVATQNFVLTVQQAPAITSAASTTFSIGAAGSFAVTSTGFPAATLSATGALPAGVTFTPGANGTGTLAGTPGPASSGVYPLTITASNGIGADATQAFVLTVDSAPIFTSANATTFTVGTFGSFAVTTSGSPGVNAIARSGALPSGVVFVDHADGTGTLSGTPDASTGGQYALTFTATNGVNAPVVQVFTLTVNQPPAMTSAASTAFSIGAAGSFAVTSTGFPAATLSSTGALPAGVTFTPGANGTATLAGTPGPASSGVYPLTITASNGVNPDATQAFVLTVNSAPVFTSAAATTFTVGTFGTFAVTTSGTPAVTAIARSGALPSGVVFVDHADGTGTLSGTPDASTGGQYALTFTATNGVNAPVVQTFTLTVNQAPAITSGPGATFDVGAAGTFTVTSTGFPAATLASTGALPAGVTFTPGANGTATLAGTPGPASSGVYPLTITASNGVNPDATQAFVLTVNSAPVFTSAAATTFTVGTFGTFAVTTSGTPAVTAIARSGALPSGVVFVDHADGTGTLSGTPGPSTGGPYALTFTATNGVGAPVVQTFTLTVNQAPAITSGPGATFDVGAAGTFTVTSTGFPAATLASTGALPAGVTFTPGANGTATLAGTPAPGTAGPYSLSFTATNGVGAPAVQAFTLTVSECSGVTLTPPAGPLAAGTFGVAYSQAFIATGGSGHVFTVSSGVLPPGLSLSTSGLLSGTPTGTGSFGFTVTAQPSTGCSGAATYSLQIAPNAVDESFPVGVGNTQLSVGAGVPSTPAVVIAGSVLTNDGGPGPLTAGPAGISTTAGGSVAMAANGSFVYTPAPGFAGSDTFVYTLTDGNGVSDTATVTVGVSGMVWYVNAALGAGDGRSSNPFNDMVSASTSAQAGQAIYVHAGSPAGSTALKASQTLWGAGAVFTVGGLTIPAATAPTLAGTVTLANGVTVGGLSVNGGAGAAIVANGVTGAVALNHVAITGGSTGVQINGGTATMTIDATIAGTTVRSVDVQNKTAGTVTFSGAITGGAGGGILLNANTGASIAFTGGMALTTGANNAFTATGGGIVTVTQDNVTVVNTIETIQGVALNVSDTEIGSAGLTFRSISAGEQTPSLGNGIVLSNTGVAAGNGGLTVAGNNVPGSGGQLRRKQGADGSLTGGFGILLVNTKAPAFHWMYLFEFQNAAIAGRGVAGFTLTNSVIEGFVGTTPGIFEGPVVFGEPGPAGANGATGTVQISDTLISGGVDHNLAFYNRSGALTLTINGTAAGETPSCIVTGREGGTGRNGLVVQFEGTATGTLNVERCRIRDNPDQAVLVTAADTSNLTVNLTRSEFVHAARGDEGVVLANAGSAALTATLTDNTMSDFPGPAIRVDQAENATSVSLLRVTIQGVAQDTQQETPSFRVYAPVGAVSPAILARFAGTASNARLLVNNVLVESVGTQPGIAITTPHALGSPVASVTLTNNHVDLQRGVPPEEQQPGLVGIALQTTAAGANLCANVRSNSSHLFPPPAVLVDAGIRAEQVSGTFNLEQGESGISDPASTVLQVNNAGALPAPAGASFTEALGTIGVVANGQCLLPSAP